MMTFIFVTQWLELGSDRAGFCLRPYEHVRTEADATQGARETRRGPCPCGRVICAKSAQFERRYFLFNFCFLKYFFFERTKEEKFRPKPRRQPKRLSLQVTTPPEPLDRPNPEA